MQVKPKITIVTPSFNQGCFIERTLRSVADQGVPAIEHIVVDGGSTDGTIDVLQRYGEGLGWWCSEKDGGQTDALNRGFARAQGEFVGWINSDDFYLPGAVASVLERFAQSDRPDVIFGYGVSVDRDNRVLKEMRHDDFNLSTCASVGFDMTQQALFVRREALDRVLPLDRRLRFCMDLDLVIRLGLIGARFVRMPRFLAAFRRHGAAKTSMLQDVHIREKEQLLSDLRGQLRRRGVRREPWMVAMIRRRLRFVARGEVRYAVLGGRVGLTRDAIRSVHG